MPKRDHALLILGVEALAIVGVVYHLVTFDPQVEGYSTAMSRTQVTPKRSVSCP